MTRWLELRSPDASPALQLACRAQHFRRWEIPRSSYPMTRPGYLTWRAKLKAQAASQITELLASPAITPPLPQDAIERTAALIRKENLSKDEETQVLEDVACLVFLDDQFDDFHKRPEIDEEKIIGILRKTWAKMSPKGQELALWADSSSESPPTQPDRNAKPPLGNLISTHDFAAAARESFPPKTLAFVTSAATDLHTHRRNSEAYSLIGLRPRVLRDVRTVSIATTMLGHRLRTPIFCAPTSLGKTVHPEGEKDIGRACKALGTAQVVSTSASFPLGEIVSAVRSHRAPAGTAAAEAEAEADGSPVPIFFQLYVDKNRAKSEALLRSASALGIAGLFLTVDAPVPGKREADERQSISGLVSSPMTGASAKGDAKGGALGRLMGSYIDAGVTWADVAWLRRHLPPGTPVVLKGVQTAADARLAAQCGVDAVVLSNHGGRSLDTAPAAVLVLLEMQRCCPEVFDRLEVFVDGGVARGTDVFKALCLGARAVGIGRGTLYGLNYGEEGVRRYVEILNDELETTMRMCGITSLDQVHPGFLNTGSVDHLIPTSDEHPYAKWRRGSGSKL
ncbi:cytochrome b2 [Phialemonium atrogriseum]|uniref:L-lactate dehydrogenase (cytochrome) n=1 Tax=Phialemonium atrogriseum TaxID=1093897 RepID=A0AAJ0FJD6_9PEZI|nr:[Phialemonium atrogriseum] [Phialemonium atrogriseum]KAK1770531.1 cytochrome b2 [Phialemonium atrogriseum]